MKRLASIVIAIVLAGGTPVAGNAGNLFGGLVNAGSQVLNKQTNKGQAWVNKQVDKGQAWANKQIEKLGEKTGDAGKAVQV
jgi:hypothetical protein